MSKLLLKKIESYHIGKYKIAIWGYWIYNQSKDVTHSTDPEFFSGRCCAKDP